MVLNDKNFSLIKLAELQLLEKCMIKKIGQINTIKRNEQFAKLKLQLADISKSHESAANQLNALEQERKKLEDTLNLQNEKIKNIEAKLFSGTITSSKELFNYQEEIKQFKSSNDSLEDRELQIMMEIDECRPKLRDIEEKKTALEKEIKAMVKDINEKINDINKSIIEVKNKRRAAISEIPKDILIKYDSVKQKKGGIALAVMKNKVCDACRMELPAGELDKIKDLDQIYRCPTCGRMLIIHRDEIDNIIESLGCL